MKKNFLFVLLFGIFTLPAISQQQSSGLTQAFCTATMHYAIGESSGALKIQYQKILGDFYVLGINIAGPTEFTKMIEDSKKVLISYSNEDFKSMVQTCVSIAPN